MVDSMESKYEKLLSQTAKLAYYKEKAQKSEQDLKRSVEFMRSALFAIQREFHDETVQKNQDSRCAEREFLLRILAEGGSNPTGEAGEADGDNVDLEQLEDDDPLMLQQTFMVQEDKRICELYQELEPQPSQETKVQSRPSRAKKQSPPN